MNTPDLPPEGVAPAKDGGGCATLFVYLAAAMAALLLLGLCLGAVGLVFFEEEIGVIMSGGTRVVPSATPAGEPGPTRSPSATSGAPATAAVMTLPPTAAALATEAAAGATVTPGLLPTLRPTETRRPVVISATPSEPITLLLYTSCGAEDMAQFPRNARITFEWNWAGTLASGEFLEVRVGPLGNANLSGIGGQVDPSLRDGTRYRWPLQASQFFVDGVTEYAWQVAYVSAGGEVKMESARGCIRVS